jgi:N-acetylglucosamine-6-phosphate deacetylase
MAIIGNPTMGFGQNVCKAIGLAPEKIARLEVIMDAREVLTLNITMFGDESINNAVIPELENRGVVVNLSHTPACRS